MRLFFFIFLSAILAVSSLSAKPLSQREKRLNSKSKFKIDKSVVVTNTVDETFFANIKPEKSLKDDLRQEKTTRDQTIWRETILKPSGKAKQRKNTHIREWP